MPTRYPCEATQAGCEGRSLVSVCPSLLRGILFLDMEVPFLIIMANKNIFVYV